MSIAELLDKSRGRTAKDEMDEVKIAKRVKTASNHLRKLAQIGPQLSPADFNKIRDTLNVIAETYLKQYKDPKSTSAPVNKEPVKTS